MSGAAAISIARKPEQPVYWGNMVAVAILGYALILAVIFVATYFSRKRKE